MLSNLKISQKIAALLALLGLVTLVLAFYGASRIQNVETQFSALVDNKLAGAMYRSRSNTRMNAMMYDGYKLLSVSGTASTADVIRQLEEDGEKAESDLEAAIERDPGSERELSETLAGGQRIRELLMRSAEFARSGNAEAARPLLARADAEMRDVFGPSLTLVDRHSDEAEARSDELTELAGETRMILIVVAFLSVVVSVAFGLFVARKGITGPLDHLKGQMGEIAEGDFSKEVEGTGRGDEVGAMARAVQVFRDNGIAKAEADKAKAKAEADQKMVVDTVSTHLSELSNGNLTANISADFPGEFTALKANFNNAIANLRELIGSVRQSAATISTGSNEIAQASENLARRTESNAASLEETAAAVTQMDERLKTTAEAASRTVERADKAVAVVDSGRSVAEEAVQAMNSAAEGAKGIDSVIEGLDKIAFQTRVLAMNAAVEAGRAGEAGRGFAVVADLVSALAMRSEEEAAKAREQLTTTQSDIGTAVEAVHKVDGALAEISGDVAEVHALLETMAADNRTQSVAISEISSAIGTMDQATQQNAAMVEQTSAAARNLASEVDGLNDQAGRFNVDSAATGQGTSKPMSQSQAYASPVKPLPAPAIPRFVH